MGYKTRYTFIGNFETKVPDTLIAKQQCYFRGIMKYDLQEEKVLGKIDLGDKISCGEVFFHKKENA